MTLLDRDNNLSTKDTFYNSNSVLLYRANTFSTSVKVQPSYSEINSLPQTVLYSEVPQ